MSFSYFPTASHTPLQQPQRGGAGAGRGGFILLTLISVHDQSHMDSKD